MKTLPSRRGSIGAPPPQRSASHAATEIADRIRLEIVSGRTPPGTELPPEAEFLRKTGFSKPTYRQALRILQTEGFVKVARGARGGVKVLKPDIEPMARYALSLLQMNGASYDDIRNVRLALEPVAARLVAERRDPAALSALAECAGAQRFKTDDPAAFLQDERRFRDLLAERSGNVVLLLLSDLFASIHDKYTPDTLAVEKDTDHADLERAVRAKMKLIDILSRGEGANAEARWRAYVEEFTWKVMTRTASPGAPARNRRRTGSAAAG